MGRGGVGAGTPLVTSYAMGEAAYKFKTCIAGGSEAFNQPRKLLLIHHTDLVDNKLTIASATMRRLID